MGYDQWLTLIFTLPEDSDVEQFKTRIKEFLQLSDEDWRNVDIDFTDTLEILTIHFECWRRIYEGNGFYGSTEQNWNVGKQEWETVADNRVDLRKVSKDLDCDIELQYNGEDDEDAERMTIKKGVVTSHEEMAWVNKLQPTAASR